MDFSSSPITATDVAASGALPGFTSTCSCGLEMRNTIRVSLELDVRQHDAWHQSRAACPYRVGKRICVAGAAGHASPHEWPKARKGTAR